MGLFRKGKTCIIAKFHGTDLVICSHSRERKTLACSQKKKTNKKKNVQKVFQVLELLCLSADNYVCMIAVSAVMQLSQVFL